MRNSRILAAAALAALCMGAAGCSGQSGGSPSAGSSGASTGAASGGASAAPSAARSSASKQPSAVRTPVAPPSKGSITQTVAPRRVSSAAPVAVGRAQQLPGVTVGVTSLTSQDVTATVPGDVSGPSVVVHLTLRNTAAKPLDLGQVAVDLVAGDGTPGELLASSPSKPVSGTLAPGRQATGSYGFRLDRKHQKSVRVTVQPTAQLPVATFTGGAA